METLQRVRTDAVKAQAESLGFELVGVCEAVPAPHYAEYEEWISKGYHGTMEYLREHLPLKEHPGTLLPGVRSIIAVGLNYYQPFEHVVGEPKVARYAMGRDYHKVLRGKLRALEAQLLQEHPEAGFRPCVDSAPVFERDYARLAGLGWFGKNTMLINSHRGSWFFIGLLLTTIDFEPDVPADGGCGTCTRCIEACPTGAIVHEEGRWQVDARRCISYLTIEQKGPLPEGLRTDWTFGCDVCQEVCPFNQPRESQPLRSAVTKERDFLNRRRWPNLAQLAQIEEREWDLLTQGSPVRRAGREGLRRNATHNLRR